MMQRTIVFLIVSCLAINSVFSQIDTIIWVQLSPLPDSSQINSAGYFLIDSNFYVAGGQRGNNAISTNTLWCYHIPADRWIKLQNLPFGPAACGGSFVINGKGYFLTARDSVNNYNCDTMFWEYNPSNDSWARKAGFPDAPRQNGSSFIYGGKGYVGQTYGCFSTDTHFWQYDPALDKWTQVATLPADIAAGSVAIATPSAEAYLFGGYDIGGNFLKDVWRFNIVSNQWDSIGQMPGSGRCYSSFWGFDSIIIGGGGENGYSLFNDFYHYDIAHNLWTSVVFKNSFDSTGAGACFVYNKRGYYYGGYNRLSPNTTFSNNMWSFDASKFFPPDTSVGIIDVKKDVTFSVYPNPTNRDKGVSVSTSESGSISFYDALGRVLNERKLIRGLNQIKLTTDNEVIFYRATLYDGSTQNGKLVLIK